MTYVAPPQQPVPSSTRLEVDGRVLELPTDYAALLARYGAGTFGTHLLTFAPACANPVFNIGRQTREWAETYGQYANPKRKQALLDRCAEAVQALEGHA